MIKIGKNSVFLIISRIWPHLEKKRKVNLLILILLAVTVSFSEIISLGSIVPLLGAFLNPEPIFNSSYFSPLKAILGLNKPDEIVMPLTVIFCSLSVISGGLKLLFLYLSSHFAFLVGADIGLKLFRNYLFQDYESHISINSSEAISIIIVKSGSVITGCIIPFLNILSGLILISFISVALFIAEPIVTIVMYLTILLVYFLFYRFSKNKLKDYGARVAKESNVVMKTLQESFGGIREVIIDGTQKKYVNIFKNSDYPLRLSQAKVQFISGSPKFVIESIGLVLLCLLAFFVSKNSSNFSNNIPIFGAFALGIQKMLPLAQQIFSGFALISANKVAFKETLSVLDKKRVKETKNVNTKPFKFSKNILLRDVSFKYKSSKENVLSKVEVNIKKGETIGVIGTTGAGKSTLIDLIMGLIDISAGKIIIDGYVLSKKNVRNWQKKIAHVPQNIFMADASIKENIALGSNSEVYDEDALIEAAKVADAHNFIAKLNNGYDTKIGEKGLLLSGGQRQRIGLARALYKKPELMVLDEATNALDTTTETLVVENIKNLYYRPTVVFVTHRAKILDYCDKVYLVKNGSAELMNK